MSSIKAELALAGVLGSILDALEGLHSALYGGNGNIATHVANGRALLQEAITELTAEPEEAEQDEPVGKDAQTETAKDAQTNEGGKEPEVETLVGSSVLPSYFTDKDGNTVQLGDVVRKGFTLSGIKTAKEWNELHDEERELYLEEVVKELGLIPKA